MNPGEALRLRVLTLNVRMGAGGERLDKPAYDIRASKKRDAAIARAIQSVDADIVGLQEVRSARHAQQIAAQLNLGSVYARHPSSYALNFFEWGLAVLFRFRLMRSGNFAVSFDPDVRSGRSGMWLELEVSGKPVAVMNVHLEARGRADQIAALVTMADRMARPLIVMGDFNCAPAAAALAPLQRTFADSCRAVDTANSREARAQGTMVGDRRRIDYIFVSSPGVEVTEAGLLPPPHRRVSDHVGYYADVRIKDWNRSQESA